MNLTQIKEYSMLNKINPTETKAWNDLKDHYDKIKSNHMVEMFKKDPHRADQFSIIFNDILIDYSKNRINR